MVLLYPSFVEEIIRRLDDIVSVLGAAEFLKRLAIAYLFVDELDFYHVHV